MKNNLFLIVLCFAVHCYASTKKTTYAPAHAVAAKTKLPSISQSTIPPRFQQNAATLDAKKIEELKRKRECPTIPSMRASTPLRRKCYQMCERAKIKEPHLMYVVYNDVMLDVARANEHERAGNKVLVIELGSKFAKCAYGNQECIWLHEIAHILNDDCYSECRKTNDWREIQAQEAAADLKAIEIVGCKSCIMEYGNYFFEKAKTETDPILRGRGPLKSILSELSEEDLEIDLIFAEGLSKELRTEHPSNIERALRCHLFAKKVNTVCDYHAKKESRTKQKSVTLPPVKKTAQPTASLSVSLPLLKKIRVGNQLMYVS